MTAVNGLPAVNGPRVSVIVPAYNAASTIGDCLHALRLQSYGQPYEIIVVDDGSTDATATLAAERGARVLRLSRGRPAAARNAGIAIATGTLICCTDADCAPAPDWLEQLTQPFNDPQVAAAKGTYATRQRSLVARFVQLEYEDKYDLIAQSATIDFIDTYSAAYRREVLMAGGAFDERFFYLEDQELSFRLAAQGYHMVFQPSAIVYHQHADRLLAYWRKKMTIGYWKIQVVRRFPGHAVRDSHTPQVMKVQMLLMAMLLTSLAGLSLSALLGLSSVTAAAVPIAIVSAVLFLATTFPFSRKAWPKDRPVALIAPVLLFVRALGLGLGTVWGMVAPPPGLENGRPPNRP